MTKIHRWWLSAASLLALGGGCVPGVDRTVDPVQIPRTSGPPPTFEAPVSAASPPPSISGGTLRALSDGHTAVAADPDRDHVFVADYLAARLIADVKLQPGDEPGRVVEDAAGRVHVALRRGGAVVTLTPGSWQVAARRAVCGAPRGLAYDPAGDQVHVACAEGELVSLPAAPDGAVTRRLRLDRDLRDVVVTKEGRLYVSRFRSAEVLAVDAQGMVQRLSPARSSTFRRPDKPSAVDMTGGGSTGQLPMVPSVAWRMVADPRGEVIVLHQRALEGEVSVAEGGSYGGQGCGGIVETTVTAMGTSRPSLIPSATLGSVTLGVDVAVSPDGEYIAVAAPGNARQLPGRSEQVTVVQASSYLVDQSSVMPGGTVDQVPPMGGCNFSSTTLPVPRAPAAPMTVADGGAAPAADGGADDGGAGADGGAPAGYDGGMPPGRDGSRPEAPPSVPPVGGDVLAAQPSGEVVAVSFDLNGQLIVQTREPATLQVLTAGGRRTVLSSESRLDTGHAIFHANSGSSMACASCHPEGGDDGRVWTFLEKDGTPAPRRTQNLRGGVLATAPFHWDGTLDSMGSLMTEVFVGRMAGPALDERYIDTLSTWLDRQPGLPAIPVTDAAAVERGRTLFTSSGCAVCHVAGLYTDNRMQTVGTGRALQTPSLRGAAWRAPYMHDGCAATLRDRFTNAACGGGDAHGATSQLTGAQIDDLVTFVETL